MDDQADVSFVHPELGGEFGIRPMAGFVKRPDRDDVTFLKLGPALPFSACRVFRVSSRMVVVSGLDSSFGGGVANVGPNISEPQMERVHAGRIVTGMTHQERAWIFPMIEKVGDAMRSDDPVWLS